MRSNRCIFTAGYVSSSICNGGRARVLSLCVSVSVLFSHGPGVRVFGSACSLRVLYSAGAVFVVNPLALQGVFTPFVGPFFRPFHFSELRVSLLCCTLEIRRDQKFQEISGRPLRLGALLIALCTKKGVFLT